MQIIEWRLDVIVNQNLLNKYMKHRSETCRSLAMKVGCSHSRIGHYKTGKRKHCDSATAQKIAAILDMPVDPLFLAEPSRVSREVKIKVSA